MTNFKNARELAIVNHSAYSIGTLGEKTLHATLKNYFADACFQEQKVGRFHADIKINDLIMEIQTQSFNCLRQRLEYFLNDYTVIVVCPIIAEKYIEWINEDFTVIRKRKSPRKGGFLAIFKELYKIKNLLAHPRLHLQLMLIDVVEYRLIKKDGSIRKYDNLPLVIKDEVLIAKSSDYYQILPELPQKFSSRLFMQIAHISLQNAQLALNVLKYLNVVKSVGKEGNAIIYSLVNNV